MPMHVNAAVVGFSGVEGSQLGSRCVAGFRASGEFIFLARRTVLMCSG